MTHFFFHKCIASPKIQTLLLLNKTFIVLFWQLPEIIYTKNHLTNCYATVKYSI